MIYFDNAASTWPKPEAVVRRTREWFGENGANPGRSSHRPGRTAGAAIRETRQRVAELLEVGDPDRVAFTHNATHALNIALKGLLRTGDHVVTSVLEHNSILRPLTQLREERGITLTAVEPDARGTLDPDAVTGALRPETRVVALTHASNVLGTVQPIGRIVHAVRAERGEEVFVLVDAAQTGGVLDLPVEAWDVDLLALAGHKGLFGIQGTGALWVGEGVPVEPYVTGGTGSRSHEARHPRAMPDRLEAGTTNTPGLVALGAGLRFLRETGLDAIREKEARLGGRLRDGLRAMPGVRVHPRPGRDPGTGGDGADAGPTPETVAVVSFEIGAGDPAEAAFLYDRRFGIAVRAGVHCAPWTHRWLGTLDREPQGTIRASPGFFNTEDEVDRFLEATRELVELLPGGEPTEPPTPSRAERERKRETTG